MPGETMHVRTLACLGVISLALGLSFACSRPSPSVSDSQPRKHLHHPPHGGTAVVLGDEVYHLELVLDAPAGRLSVYVLDGEMENFVRIAAAGFQVEVTTPAATHLLTLLPVANPQTGETAGDTALFEAQADWLKGLHEFDGSVKSLMIRNSQFSNVRFNFPKGNDTD